METMQNKNDGIETVDDRFVEVCRHIKDDSNADQGEMFDLILSICDLNNETKRLLNIFYYSGRSTAIRELNPNMDSR